jgi:hypothetical protein
VELSGSSDPKSGGTVVKGAGCEGGVLAGPYPLSRCAWKGGGTGVELMAAMVRKPER